MVNQPNEYTEVSEALIVKKVQPDVLTEEDTSNSQKLLEDSQETTLNNHSTVTINESNEDSNDVD